MRPERLTWRGRVAADAIWLDLRWLGADEARRRALRWIDRCGGVVRGRAGELLVCLDRATVVDAASVDGVPLVRVAAGGAGTPAHLLSAAPLSVRERVALPPAATVHVLLVRGGVAELESLAAFAVIDPAGWLDVSDVEICALEPVAVPVSATEPVEAPGTSPAATELFGRKAAPWVRVPAPKGPFWARLRATWRFRAAQLGALGALLSSAIGIGSGVASAAAPGRGARGAADKRARRRDPAPAGTPRRSWLRSAFDRLMIVGGFAAAASFAHALTIARVLRFIDAGDLDAALRHAPPAGGDGGGEGLLAWLPFRPRRALAISGARKNRRSMLVGRQLLAGVRAAYQRVLDELVRRGRVEDAAFVLVELLGKDAEGIALLEKHGLFRRAAEIAEVRNQAPPLVARLWFLARDRVRAIDLARRTQCFADVVARLERSHPDEARELRREWGEHLAAAGDHAAAVDVLWADAELRDRVREWAERGFATGGRVAARMAARLAHLDPDALTSIGGYACELLDDPAPERAVEREMLARGLAEGEATAAVRALGRRAARALVRDSGEQAAARRDRQALIRKLVDRAQDPALAADLPKVGSPAGRGSLTERDSLERRLREAAKLVPVRAEPVVLAIPPAAGVGLPILDVARLDDGKWLVALGELGVGLLARDGRMLARFEVPAEHLVLSDHGTRAIALARAGTLWRLARIEIPERRARPWCNASLTSWAPTYDGSIWFAGVGNALHAIDALTEGWRSLWVWKELDGVAIFVARAPQSLAFVVLHRDGNREVWIVELPGMTLRARNPVPLPVPDIRARNTAPSPMRAIRSWVALTPEGWMITCSEDEKPLRLELARNVQMRLPAGGHPRGGATVGSDHLAVVAQHPAHPAASVVQLVQRSHGRHIAQIELGEVDAACTRLSERGLAIGDHAGRIAYYDFVRESLETSLLVLA